MMTWYGIQMRTITDDTTSKLSELLMQGTNMGIIEGRRLINQNNNISPDVKHILNDFVVMQEDSVETLKSIFNTKGCPQLSQMDNWGLSLIVI